MNFDGSYSSKMYFLWETLKASNIRENHLKAWEADQSFWCLHLAVMMSILLIAGLEIVNCSNLSIWNIKFCPFERTDSLDVRQNRNYVSF